MSALFPQMLLGLHDELLVDLFAGGGGASCGIEMATGRTVDIAINHDPAAVAMHRINHPQTDHHVCDVFEADPREVTGGRPVGLLWASPDCTHHSKARGGKPLRDGARKRRALAWVVTRWAGQVRPRVIMLENVEEFADWGPLVGPADSLRPCPKRKGRTFKKWVRSLRALGYQVEWRELRACDYGAPTIRKRLFVIARCDGRPIVWPKPTHGEGKGLKPYRSAAECIDWSVPMLSIFATREEAKEWARAHREAGRQIGTPVRPLAEATMRRIARGVMRYVVESPEPYIVGVGGRAGQSPERSLREPYQTITAKGDAALVAPYLIPRYGEREGQEPRTRSIEEPSPVVVPSGNGASLCAAFLAKHFTGVVGSDLREPKGTVTTIDHDALVTASLERFAISCNCGNQFVGTLQDPCPACGEITSGHISELTAGALAKLRGTSSDADPADPLHTVSAGGTHHGVIAAHIQRDFGASVGHDADEPLGTVTSGGGGKAGVVAAFLQSYYGTHQDGSPSDPLATVTTKDRHSLVTVEVAGESYVLADIAMRMLQPRELYNAQGFQPDYRINVEFWDSKQKRLRWLTKTEQVRMCGNSVCPPMAAALARVNVPELRARDEVAA